MRNTFSKNIEIIRNYRIKGASDIEIIEKLHSMDITIIQSIAIYADIMDLRFSDAKQHIYNSNLWKDSVIQLNKNTKEFLDTIEKDNNTPFSSSNE